MSYTIRNMGAFFAARNNNWWRIVNIADLERGLREVLYGVNESQRDGFQVLQDFLNLATLGSAVFGPTTRFPSGDEDQYYTEFRGTMSRIINAIQAALAFRQDKLGKDVVAATKPGEDKNYTEKNQERQDNTKRFEEILNLLAVLKRDPSQIWWQGVFEQRLTLTWVSAVAAAGSG